MERSEWLLGQPGGGRNGGELEVCVPLWEVVSEKKIGVLAQSRVQTAHKPAETVPSPSFVRLGFLPRHLARAEQAWRGAFRPRGGTTQDTMASSRDQSLGHGKFTPAQHARRPKPTSNVPRKGWHEE